MSGLNIKLADLQISDFHAPECCFLWWHTEKTFSFWGRCPPDPYQGLCPWTPLGAYCGPQTPASFSSFLTFSQSHVCIIFWLVFVKITRQIISRFFVTLFESDWPSESWTWGVKDRWFDMVFLLWTRCSNASVFRSYSSWRGSPWLLTRGSYSHRWDTEMKVLV